MRLRKLKKLYRDTKRIGYRVLYSKAILKEEFDNDWLNAKWQDRNPNMLILRGENWLNPENTVDLSLIIPVYNCEKYMERLLKEIVNQNTNYSYEAICVDDGSIDASGSICDAFAKEYPSVIKVIHQKNGGISAARNVGISESVGKYIGFIDDDDEISSLYVEKILSTAFANNADIVKSAYRNCDSDGKVICVSNTKNVVSRKNRNRIDNILCYNYLWGGLTGEAFFNGCNCQSVGGLRM